MIKLVKQIICNSLNNINVSTCTVVGSQKYNHSHHNLHGQFAIGEKMSEDNHKCKSDRQPSNLGNISPKKAPGLILNRPNAICSTNISQSCSGMDKNESTDNNSVVFKIDEKHDHHSSEILKKTVLPKKLLDQVTGIMHDKTQGNCTDVLVENSKVQENLFKFKPSDSTCIETKDNDSTYSQDSIDESAAYDLSVLFSDEYDQAYKRYMQENKKKVKKRKHNSSLEPTQGYDAKEKRIKKCLPNYFLAVQVDDPLVHKNLSIVQKYLLDVNPALQKAIVPVATAHITIMVMHLAGEADVKKAADILKKCEDKLLDFVSDPIVLDVSGLGNFKDEVIFAKCTQIERLQKLTDIVTEMFKEEGINSSDTKGFKPHITILKLSKAPKLRRKGIKKVSPSHYAPYKESLFGKQTVAKVQLCAMLKPKDENGYYLVEDFVKTVSDNFENLESTDIPHLELIKPERRLHTETHFTVDFEKDLHWAFHESERCGTEDSMD